MIISLLKVHQTFFQEITLKPLRNEEYRKIRKNPKKSEKIRKPDRFLGKNIIISFLRSKPNNLSRNIAIAHEVKNAQKSVFQNFSIYFHCALIIVDEIEQEKFFLVVERRLLYPCWTTIFQELLPLVESGERPCRNFIQWIN